MTWGSAICNIWKFKFAKWHCICSLRGRTASLQINCDLDMTVFPLQKTKTLMPYKLCQTKSGPFKLGLYPAVSLHFSLLAATSLADGFSFTNQKTRERKSRHVKRDTRKRELSMKNEEKKTCLASLAIEICFPKSHTLTWYWWALLSGTFPIWSLLNL